MLFKDKQIVIPNRKKLPSINELKGQKFCKFHQMTGHTIITCVHLMDLIQKAIKVGWLKFKEKEAAMKVDTNPFEVNSNFAETIYISANVAGIEIGPIANIEGMKWANELEHNHFKDVERSIFLITRESLLNFYQDSMMSKGTYHYAPSAALYSIEILQRNLRKGSSMTNR